MSLITMICMHDVVHIVTKTNAISRSASTHEEKCNAIRTMLISYVCKYSSIVNEADILERDKEFLREQISNIYQSFWNFEKANERRQDTVN